jgi:hypothetical protein
LNPYQTPSSEATRLKWRPHPACVHIQISVGGFFASLVVGCLLQDVSFIVRIIVPYGIVLISFLLGYLAYLRWPRDAAKPASHIWGESILIWLIMPFGAAMNAFATATRSYDPKVHDQYPYSLTYWWGGLIVLMVIGTGVMLLYHYDVQTKPIKPSVKMYFLISIVLQIPIWLAWGFAPNLLD